MKKCLLQDFNMNGIYDALKAVTVEITWNGGKTGGNNTFKFEKIK